MNNFFNALKWILIFLGTFLLISLIYCSVQQYRAEKACMTQNLTLISFKINWNEDLRTHYAVYAKCSDNKIYGVCEREDEWHMHTVLSLCAN